MVSAAFSAHKAGWQEERHRGPVVGKLGQPEQPLGLLFMPLGAMTPVEGAQGPAPAMSLK